jgi:hypothetical protein
VPEYRDNRSVVVRADLGPIAWETAQEEATTTALTTTAPRRREGLAGILAEPGRLLESLLARPWGQVSASVYETGRLVTLAPWLRGHDERVRFLLGAQRGDGSWSRPGPYGLVPTLSATEALLSELRRTPTPTVADACTRGLAALSRAVGRVDATGLPDTPAVEVLVPVLVEAVNTHLAARPPGVAGAPLRLPDGVDAPLAAALRELIASGAALPEKALHALEIAGAGARGARGVPVPPGTVGASPAATAAWLGARTRRSAQRDPAALAYLEGAAVPHAGPVPSVLPITMFERAWVLDSLLRCGVPVRVPAELVASLVHGLGPLGTPGGGGLPCDADTTSITILTAHRLKGRRRRVGLGALRHYETPSHFVTWDGERTASTTTNAHVLDCLVGVADDPALETWRDAAVRRVARWLLEQQRDDGTWADKWHASPLYATAAVAAALRRTGGRMGRAALARAVAWLLDQQRRDGSWGIWGATAEETAYALHLLIPVLASRVPTGLDRAHVLDAAARGLAFLRARTLRPTMPVHAPLWHDKDLYTPTAVVDAAVVGALHLAGSHPAVGRAASATARSRT